MEEDFDNWNNFKKELDHALVKLSFKEREIWWYAAGKNIGTEIDGKGESFARPVLIIRKYGKSSFFGVPLSSQIHNGRWFTPIIVRDKMRDAMLSQARSYSVNRLLSKIERVSESEFMRICDELRELFFKK